MAAQTEQQRIVPHIWLDSQAVEAAEFYASVFPNSEIKSVHKITDRPAGDCDVVSFSLAGFQIEAISAGPQFTISPSISFIVNFDPSRDPNARGNLDAIWAKLADGGQIRMALDAYPFSGGSGFSGPIGEIRPFIVPSLMFTGDV